jgi:hypothetical protein
MFARFRLMPSGRLNVALAENRRVGGKVRQEHVAHLGAIDSRLLDVTQAPHIPNWELLSLRARVRFWDVANDRFGRLSNRLGPDLKRIRIAVHKRVPWPMEPERERLAGLEAGDDAEFWFRMYGQTNKMIEVNERLIEHANKQNSELRAQALREITAANEAKAGAAQKK